jgi:hypothetical protein
VGHAVRRRRSPTVRTVDGSCTPEVSVTGTLSSMPPSNKRTSPMFFGLKYVMAIYAVRPKCMKFKFKVGPARGGWMRTEKPGCRDQKKSRMKWINSNGRLRIYGGNTEPNGAVVAEPLRRRFRSLAALPVSPPHGAVQRHSDSARFAARLFIGEAEGLPKFIAVAVGSFADPTFPSPKAHSVWERRRHRRL